MQETAQIICVSQFILLTIYFKRDTSKDLMHKIGFKFGMFNWNLLKLISTKVICLSIGTVDSRVLLLVI
jgi:hypothetical protein